MDVLNAWLSAYMAASAGALDSLDAGNNVSVKVNAMTPSLRCVDLANNVGDGVDGDGGLIAL